MYSYASDGKTACMENKREVVFLFLELKEDTKEWRRMSKRFFELSLSEKKANRNLLAAHRNFSPHCLIFNSIFLLVLC